MVRKEITPPLLAQYIDHTLLRPEAKESEILRVCDEAIEYRFKGVCVEKKWLPLVVKRLDRTQVLPITVISFPQGNSATSVKSEEALAAYNEGAREMDMVLHREWLKEKKYSAVCADIEAVVNAASGCPVKVILETSELSEKEIILACGISKIAGAQFVKTSTGFSKSGAREDDVSLMREIVGADMGVKASGGIKTYAIALAMIQAGANRLGTSASVSIMKEAS